MSFLAELKRRNVIGMAGLYLAGHHGSRCSPVHRGCHERAPGPGGRRLPRSLIFAFVCALLVAFQSAGLAEAKWPMSNDPAFDATVASPAFPPAKGPTILLDKAHHNFFVQWDLIQPFADLARADGFQPVVGDEPFTPEYLARFDIVMIITALPFDFTTRTEVTTEATFSDAELTAVRDWVAAGGSLLVFSEHAPFDQAINPLLQRFGIRSSVGTIADPLHHDQALGQEGWIVYSRENGLLNHEHPIVSGRTAAEAIDRVISFGGSALTGEGSNTRAFATCRWVLCRT